MSSAGNVHGREVLCSRRVLNIIPRDFPGEPTKEKDSRLRGKMQAANAGDADNWLE